MKYLAILKDSLLEALDSKVLYVMMGLSLFVVILVASVSYHPITVEEDAERVLSNFGDSYQYMTGATSVRWKFTKVDDVQASKDGVKVSRHDDMNEPWLYDYSFTVVYTASVSSNEQLTPEAKREILENSFTGLPDNVKSHLGWQGVFPYLKDKTVHKENALDGETLKLQVSTHGTTVHQREDWPHSIKLFFLVPVSKAFQFPLSGYLYFIEDWLVCSWGAGAALLLSIIMTGFFIPNMLRKGTIDFLIVKPISRTTLLLYKYIGGMSYMLINTVVIVMGIWLVLGLRSGHWGTAFLISIPILTFEFAIFYAVSALFAVLTRSTIVSILMACAAWAALFIVGTAYKVIDDTRHIREEVAIAESRTSRGDDRNHDDHVPDRLLPDTVYTIADAIHFVLPRMKDLDVIITRYVRLDLLAPDSAERKVAEKRYDSFNLWEASAVTGLWVAGTLALSCWLFYIKDY